MVLSSFDRQKLISRVEGYLAPGRLDGALVGAAVDRVAAALPNEVGAAPAVVVVSATNMPDLGSRLRSALPEPLRGLRFEAATDGRHTVVCCEAPEEAATAVQQAAERIGAQSWLSEAGQ